MTIEYGLLNLWACFLVNLIFSFFNTSPNKDSLLWDKPIWKSRSPPRVSLLFGLQFLTGLTLMMCYKSTGLSIIPIPICVLCAVLVWKPWQLFLHCSGMNHLWNKVSRFLEGTGCPKDLHHFLPVKFKEFHKQATVQW